MWPIHNDFELSHSRAESQESLLEDSRRQFPSTRFGRVDYLRNWFPEVEPKTNGSWVERFSDRDVALLLMQCLSVIVFVFNLAVTLWAFATFGAHDNVSDILQTENGYDCNRVKVWNRWLHLGINALSTLLLGSSNYCAQLLVAPTRRQVDDAHRQKNWLDVGIQSFRNLRVVSLKQRVLWTLLMLTSGLLHIFWNSAVFAATPFSTYSIGYVTADFMDDQQPWLYPTSPDLTSIRENATNIPKLNNTDCIARYAGKTSGLSSLLLVSANITMDQQLSYEQSNTGSSLLFNDTTVRKPIFWRMNSDWMCSAWSSYGKPSSSSCTQKVLSPHAESWTLARFETVGNLWTKVAYCIPLDKSQDMDDKCVLRISKIILGLVTLLNFAKCICIAYTIHILDGNIKTTFARAFQVLVKAKEAKETRHSMRLVTIGDAIASFLEEPDPHTRELSCATKKDFVNKWPSQYYRSQPKHASVHWCHAASLRRWYITGSLCVVTIGVVAGLLCMTIVAQQEQGVETDLASLRSYGLGTPQQWALALTTVTENLSQTQGFFFAVFFANMFQVIVSALYLLCNNLLTVMLVAAEWNDFISERKALRLSVPKGIQRSTYFLSLPYRYSIPLMLLSALLHWFISQSVFVAQTVAYLPKYMPPRFERAFNLDSSGIAFSSIGVILALTVGSILVVSLFFVGFVFRYEARSKGDAGKKPPYTMPVVGTCSAAISANCHRDPDDRDCVALKVQWGYVNGHFTFTTDADVHHPSIRC